MNYMKQVAKMLGVELGEVFCIKAYGPIFKYKITEYGIEYLNVTDKWCESNPNLINEILTGRQVIRKIPWMPKEDDKYFFQV